ncbi:DUF4915 domain-containing protein [Nitrosospira sp. Nsp1]|uniref:DUF4915 domain-containing protein n=1 Tax=Nitrosospira sp. Nsp1 TaxID=136547 RepID=UPI00115FCA2F|nr:DUF4915 domain-containing protein [Nitrosospira sp. Nsp1]
MNDCAIEDNLLVSCPGIGGMVYLEGSSDAIIINTRPSTGICFGKSELVWANQDNGGRYLTEAKNGLARQIEISPCPLDIHDVLLKDDKIYLASTYDNEVVCLNSNYQRINAWNLPGENDSAHLNSIAIYQGRLIASLFGRFKKHREYKNGTLGLGAIIDVHTGETLIGGLSQPHSLTVKGDLLYFCSSEEKKLHVYDGKNIINTVLLPGYSRGVAVGKNYIYVGISLSRNVEPVEHELASGAVSVIDKISLQCIGLKLIPFREIYDIRIIPRFADLLSLVAANASEIEKFNQTIAERDKQIFQLNQVIFDGNKETTKCIKEVAERNKQIVELNGKVTALLSSTSWKVTKPIRAAKNIINSLRLNDAPIAAEQNADQSKSGPSTIPQRLVHTAPVHDSNLLNQEVSRTKESFIKKSEIQIPIAERTPPMLIWKDDLHLQINEVNFHLAWDTAELHGGSSTADDFLLGKPRHMVEKSVEIGRQQKISKIFEMGIFKGGSVALYDQIFQPIKIAAIDYMPEPVPALSNYIARHSKLDVLKPYYGVSQADRPTMERILSFEFPERDIDLIIDDASHLYEETRDAFNISFPYLTPGGLYIIEDWAWAHWANDPWQSKNSYFYGKTALSNLLIELFMLSASRPDFITEIVVNHNSVTVKKGYGELPTDNFNIADHYLLRGRHFGAWL